MAGLNGRNTVQQFHVEISIRGTQTANEHVVVDLNILKSNWVTDSVNYYDTIY
jgi:6-pyruvoyl-tetrahydropterin synthase